MVASWLKVPVVVSSLTGCFHLRVSELKIANRQCYVLLGRPHHSHSGSLSSPQTTLLLWMNSKLDLGQCGDNPETVACS